MTEYQCNKKGHNDNLLHRIVKDMPRPEGNVDIVIVETCPKCIKEAVLEFKRAL